MNITSVSKQKQKLLLMKKIFEIRTDEEHPLTGAELIKILASYDIKAERKTIYDDIKTLCDSGMAIETTKIGHSNAYYLADRTFQQEELFILADAVASSKFLTQKKSKELIMKIQSLTSKHKAGELNRQIFVENRTKSFNEQIYYAVNKIQEGIFNNHNITFKYYEYSADKKKKLKHNGEIYTVSPFSMILQNEKYYLICYCYKHKKICRYRVDRMTMVDVSNEQRIKLTDEQKQEINNQQSVFSMFSGECMDITIEFDNSLINVVIDRFGDKVICHKNSENTFYINQQVQIAPTFWGWLFQFGKQAKVIAPQEAVDLARKAISDIAENY